jgi:hypothetical protein
MKNEPWIWGLLIPSLYAIIAYFGTCIRFPSPFTAKIADDISTVIFYLACSYISGVIVWMLTIFFPLARKAKALLPNAVKILMTLKQEFQLLGCEISGEDLVENKCGDTEELLFRDLSGNDYDPNNIEREVSISTDGWSTLVKYQKRIDSSLLGLLLDYEPYLSSKNVEIITKIRESFVLYEIRTNPNAYKCHSKTLMDAFIPNLIEIGKMINELHSQLSLMYGLDHQK